MSRPRAAVSFIRCPFSSPMRVSECRRASFCAQHRVVGASALARQREQLGDGDAAVVLVRPHRRDVAGPQVEEALLRCPGGGKPPPPLPAPMPLRSKNSVVLATAQPLLSPPMRSASSTTASSKNTSLNSARPVISRSGRMVTPGWSSLNANHEMPACFGTSKSVRARSMP